MIIRLITTFTLLLFFMRATSATALPIGFGYNQGDLKFMELESDNFRIYHDSRTPDEARLTLESLEAAKPHLERWLSVKRETPLIVNMSAASDNASFANFITDSIELQTLGQGGRDLAWHEYTHSMMYRHLDNWFGPAGAILHLPWMEAWFLEGLAEAISVSIGSDEQAGVERFQALSGQWPSWDRIHSLYTSGPFNYRGYATSGAFVSWILRINDANKLASALEQFKAKSMPWYWPWALTPFNGFLPMDHALEHLTEEKGRQLYEQYKAEATKFWTSKVKAPTLAQGVKTTALKRSPWLFAFENGKLEVKSTKEDVVGVLEAKSGQLRAWVNSYDASANDRRLRIGLKTEGSKTRWIKRDKSTFVDGIWISYSDVWWLETNTQSSRLCKAPIDKFKSDSITCKLTATMPHHLRILGHHNEPTENVTSAIWLAKDEELISGDQHQLIEVQLASGVERTLTSNIGGRPISMAYAGNSRWLLVADRSLRHLVKLEADDRCAEMVEIADYPVRIIGSADARPNVILFTADGYGLFSPDPKRLPPLPCKNLSQRTSPLLETIRAGKALTLAEAVKASDIWSDGKTHDPKNPILGQNNAASPLTKAKSKPARWRGRPVFAFPWIGADDPIGPQIGVISVPLMDELQNETVRLTMLYGAASRFPYQDVTIYTNRFAPTWSASAFRSQVYNGRYRSRSNNQIYSSYLEESGGRLDGVYSQSWKNLTAEYSWGIKTSHLKPYIGSARRVGHLNEGYGSLSLTGNIGDSGYASSSLRTRFASPAVNNVYHYDIVSLNSAAGMYVGAAKFELGLDGSRTRGPKRRDLQEMYTPLKTLIPGSGAGYNQTNFALTEDYGLFSPIYGENQARAKFFATYPLMKDIDKFISILYMDRLDVSGFYNHGTAWRNREWPDSSDLIGAHGYSVDLFLDNKGVHFNVGLGVGQVISEPWQAYWTFGFDALF